MMRKSFGTLLSAVLVGLSIVSGAEAQFWLPLGPRFGAIELGVYNLVPTGPAAPPVFNPLTGTLITVGAGYPALNGLNLPQPGLVFTGFNQPLPLFASRLPDAGAGPFGGGSALVGALAGGFAGAVVTSYFIADKAPHGIVPGTGSVLTAGFHAEWKNFGPNTNLTYSHLLSDSVTLPPGAIAQIGIISSMDVGFHNLLNQFVPLFTVSPTPIFVAFDGPGPLPDAIQAQLSRTLVDLNGVLHIAAISSVTAVIPTGGSIVLRGTSTWIADPDAVIGQENFPTDLPGYTPPNVVAGAAENIEDLVVETVPLPTLSDWGLILLALVLLPAAVLVRRGSSVVLVSR